MTGKPPESAHHDQEQYDQAQARHTGGHDSRPTCEELQLLKDNYCEACKGMWWMEDTGCYETCEGFADELAELRAEEN